MLWHRIESHQPGTIRMGLTISGKADHEWIQDNIVDSGLIGTGTIRIMH